MSTDVIEHLDRYLAHFGWWPTADEQRADALDEAFAAHAEGGWETWSPARRAVAGEQLVYRLTGIDVGEIDGLVGPATRYAREAYAHWREHGTLPEWRDSEPTKEIDRGAAKVFPRERDLVATFGEPGAAIRASVVKVRCPWPLRIAWDLSSTRLHLWSAPDCADQLAEVLEQVHQDYGPREIVRLRLDIFGGDYNHRRKRGGTSWSTHAFGRAWDWDPERNQLRWSAERASLARPEYRDWWEIWEALGFVSLGRERDRDWMHLQAARL